MSVYLNVPYASQLATPGANQADDLNACWYACVCMIGGFFEAGPRQGVPELHSSWAEANLGVNISRETQGYSPLEDSGARMAMQVFAGGQDEVLLLQKRERLTTLNHRAGAEYTLTELERGLRSYGPLLFRWDRPLPNGDTVGHCSVLIGLSENMMRVFYHDPANERDASMSIEEFNARMQPQSLMHREGLANTRMGGYGGLFAVWPQKKVQQ